MSSPGAVIYTANDRQRPPGPLGRSLRVALICLFNQRLTTPRLCALQSQMTTALSQLIRCNLTLPLPHCFKITMCMNERILLLITADETRVSIFCRAIRRFCMMLFIGVQPCFV